MTKRRVASPAGRVTELPEYKPALVSYVDIMGFEDLLMRASGNPADVRKRILEVQRHLTRHPNEPESADGSAVDFAFSDTVISVRYLPGPEEPRIGVLFDDLYRLQIAQIELLALGILVRGGIALGDAFTDLTKRVWFGPAR